MRCEFFGQSPRTSVRGYERWCWGITAIALLFGASSFAQSVPPEKAIVVDLHRPWLDGANWDGNHPPIVYGVDATRDRPRFSIVDANAQSLWVYRFAIPIDVLQYPIVSIKYRATGTSSSADYVLRLVTNKENDRARIDVWKGSDLVADNKEHELQQDLRELNAGGAIGTFGIGFKTDNSLGQFELQELKFSAAENSANKPLNNDAAMKVRVTDMSDQPLAGAKVIVDAERSNFARTGQTDKNGEVILTPLANEQSTHMLRVEKDGYLTIEVPNIAPDATKPVVVKTMPAVKYGGVTHDSSGQPLRRAQISIKLKPELLQQLPMRFQTNIVSDARGKWSSLPLPADASALIVTQTQIDGDGSSVTQLDASQLQLSQPIVATPAIAAGSKDKAAESSAQPAGITAIVQKIDDSTFTLLWNGIDGDQMSGTIHPEPNKDQQTKIPLADITEIDLRHGGSTSSSSSPSTRPANTLPNAQLSLAGNDRITGEVTGWSDKQISIKPTFAPNTTVQIPVASLRQLWCGTSDQIKKAQALKEQAGLDDIALAMKDDDAVAVHGVVIGIEDDALHFKYDNADRKIGLGKLVGMIMAKADESPGDDSLFESAQLLNGDQISGKLSGMDGKKLTIQTRAGQSIDVPVDQITKIVIHNGRRIYLSDLKPAKVEQTPYLDRLMEYRVDTSLSGKPITLLDGTYAHGVSMHSRCVLTYKLDGRFSEFRSKVGFLLPEGRVGQAVIRVLGDGKTLYENLDAKGDQPPADLKLSLSGVRELVLEVDYGKNDDVGDRVAFANARLLRAGDNE